MRELLNKVLYGSSNPQGVSANDGSQSLLIRPHPNNEDILLVTLTGFPKDAPPLYTISKRPTNPSFLLHRGPPAPENIIATASMHISTSTVDMSVYNQPMVQVETESVHWIRVWLHDGQGKKIAKYGSAGLMNFGEKQVSVYVPGDEFSTVMVLLSAIASKELAGVIDEVVGEVTGALLGA
ncbi:unnamed protein product [Fusarium equiseti]|uniref:Uncharacterized protein n=1 Tax=Fusarium equiseti TaxID=61235 RepID=A0A8J2IMT4_FUSEQ|nr:unnamed protein product [Fusarium equiseti]